MLNRDFAEPLCPCWRQALLVAAASCLGLTWGLSHSPVQGCSGGCLLHMWLCVLCQALGTCKEGREAGCILELGAEEEDGFSDVLLADWVIQEGFGVFLTC